MSRHKVDRCAGGGGDGGGGGGNGSGQVSGLTDTCLRKFKYRWRAATYSRTFCRLQAYDHEECAIILPCFVLRRRVSANVYILCRIRRRAPVFLPNALC